MGRPRAPTTLAIAAMVAYNMLMSKLTIQVEGRTRDRIRAHGLAGMMYDDIGLASFSLRMEHHCEGATAALMVAIRWDAALD